MERKDISDKYKWDLSKFIKDEQEYNKKLEKLDKYYRKLLSFKGKIMESKESLLDFLKTEDEYSKLEEDLYVYAFLLSDLDTRNQKNNALKFKIEKILEDNSTNLSFISPEIINTEEEIVKKYISELKDLKEYEFSLEDTFRFKKHVLLEDQEKIVSELVNAFGTPSEAHMFLDNADIDLGTILNEDKKEVKLTNANYTKYIESESREVRKSAFLNLNKYWKNHKNTVSSLYKGKVKENFANARVRNFSSPIEKSLFNDNVRIKVYDNLLETVNKNMDKMYDYLEVKRKLLNLDELHLYDVYADVIKVKEKEIPFLDGKRIVFEALEPLGKKYLNDLETLFIENRVDVYPSSGKKSGGYKWGTYNMGPYILLNYINDRDSVSTFAHEVGHAMHSYYSNKKQNYVDSEYPIILAEVASLVNEILLNEYLINNAKTNEEKVLYITDFLEHVRTILFRQTMFAEFEKLIHEKNEKNIPLTEEEMSNTYYDLCKKYFGDKVVVDEDIRYEWMRIPHFYTSFYVYKYAIGISCACKIARDIINKKEGALDNYLEFLSSGGSDYPLNILKKVDIDLEQNDVILDAIKLFEERLDMLKNLTGGKSE